MRDTICKAMREKGVGKKTCPQESSQAQSHSTKPWTGGITTELNQCGFYYYYYSNLHFKKPIAQC